MVRIAVGALWAMLVLGLFSSCPAWSQVAAPPLLPERAEASPNDLFGKPAATAKKAESFEHGVVLMLGELSRKLDMVQKELKSLKKQNQELQDAIDFLIEEEDEDDDNPIRRLWNELDEEMDEEDDEDEYREWRRKRRYHHSLNQVPGIPHRSDDELEKSADLLGALKVDPTLWNEYERRQSLPEYRAAMDAYKAENEKKSEAWFDIDRDMPGGA